jgi:hypothetical protein
MRHTFSAVLLLALAVSCSNPVKPVSNVQLVKQVQKQYSISVVDTSYNVVYVSIVDVDTTTTYTIKRGDFLIVADSGTFLQACDSSKYLGSLTVTKSQFWYF